MTDLQDAMASLRKACEEGLDASRRGQLSCRLHVDIRMRGNEDMRKGRGLVDGLQ
jgi:hypothetical protein